MKLSNLLYEHRCIDNSEYIIIKDIIGILNKAVHSRLEEYDLKSYNSIVKIASKLISSLNQKYNIISRVKDFENRMIF